MLFEGITENDGIIEEDEWEPDAEVLPELILDEDEVPVKENEEEGEGEGEDG